MAPGIFLVFFGARYTGNGTAYSVVFHEYSIGGSCRANELQLKCQTWAPGHPLENAISWRYVILTEAGRRCFPFVVTI